MDLAFSRTSLDRIKKLLTKIFLDVSKLDLTSYRRKGCARMIWDELVDVQKTRDRVMHRAETVTLAEASLAVEVAAAVTEELFPAFTKTLGYHLHDGFRLCSDGVCVMPLES